MSTCVPHRHAGIPAVNQRGADMSASNGKPEDGNAEAKGQQHEGVPDADKILDMNALGEVAGGGLPRVERPLIIEGVLYDPDKPIGGREGKSGA
jgi:hypothetical protein